MVPRPSVLKRLASFARPSHFLAGALALLLHAVGVLEPFERSLIEARFELLSRPASEGLVVIEIDAGSLRELDTWPWPRAYHAELLDRLLDVGVRQIVMDVDFSARSTPEDDLRLAQAITRAGERIVLPTFVQRERAFSSTAAYENVPHATIRRGTTPLGLANVRPEADGRIWRYSVAEDLLGGFRPSLAVFLAGTGSYTAAEFLIDFGIEAESIRRVRYVDVLRGRVDPTLLRDRNILVGSTAAELGDYLAVPVYRALPGVLIHAMAYESIVQGRMIQRSGMGATVLGLLLLLLVLAPVMGTDESTWPRTAATGVAVMTVVAALSIGAQAWAALAIDTAAFQLSVILFFAAGVVRRLRQQAILLFRQRMSQVHTRALMRAVVEDSFDGIIITDESGHVELANRAAGQILARPTSDLVGRPIDEGLRGARALPVPRKLSAEAETPKHDIELRRDDGTVVSLEVVVSVSDSRISQRFYERRQRARTLFIYTFRDVSDRQIGRAHV